METFRFYEMKNGKHISKAHGIIIYYLKNKYHREDGPAKIWPDGYREWYIKDLLHREDGPAIEGGMYESYYIHGKRMSEQEFLNWKISNILK